MNIDDVMERFTLMADLSAERAEKFRPLCTEAMGEISRRAVNVGEQAQSALCAAAAALAFYRWALMGAVNSPGSFAAGDVKITKSMGTVSLAKEAWREAEASAAPFLEDGEFLFQRTQT